MMGGEWSWGKESDPLTLSLPPPAIGRLEEREEKKIYRA
jgi:hypothetical protein